MPQTQLLLVSGALGVGGEGEREQEGEHLNSVKGLVCFFLLCFLSGASSQGFALLLHLPLWGLLEPGLGAAPALLLYRAATLARGAPVGSGHKRPCGPCPPHTSTWFAPLSRPNEQNRTEPACPKGAVQGSEERGPWGSRSLRVALGRRTPSEKPSLGNSSRTSGGCPLGGLGRRWGRWEEIELAGPLHREGPSGRGTEEGTIRAAWLVGVSRGQKCPGRK